MTAASGWQGQLRLRYGYDGQRTAIRQQYTQAPLRLQRPFYPEGPGICQTVVVHTAGGMVGGDRLTFDLSLDPQAQVLLTTAAASKIYRSTGPEAQQTVNANVAAGACLEWLPQETIVFDQARYRQSLRVNLEPGAQWLGWEVTRLGRTARGEQFLAGDWRSRTEVWQGEKPLWIDRQWLSGSPAQWHSPHGLAGCPIVASLAWVGVAVDAAWVEQLRQMGLQQLGLNTFGLSPSGDQIGVTRLPLGLLCRYRGHSSSGVRRWFIAVWQAIRQERLGGRSPIPRVWSL